MCVCMHVGVEYVCMHVCIYGCVFTHMYKCMYVVCVMFTSVVGVPMYMYGVCMHV